MPNAIATAYSDSCVIDTAIRPMPSWSARAAARPWRRTEGAPVGRRWISMSRQPMPRTPRPSTLLTASFAAHRPANVSGRSRTYRSSRSVRTRREKRRPNFASVPLIRSTLMMSIPSSVVPGGGAIPAPVAAPASPSDSAMADGPLLDRDRLRQVARLVDVGAPRERDVVGEQLERDDRQDRAQDLVGVRDPAHVVGDAADLLVTLRRDGDDLRVACAALHDVADELLVGRRSGGDRDERAFRVQERDRAVLELARRVALGVHVADLLELERALERGGVRRAPANEHEAAGVDIAARQVGRARLVELQRPRR